MDELAPSQSVDPEILLGEEGCEGRDCDWGEPPELKPAVASFLQGSPEILHEEGEKMLPEHPVSNFAEWVHWKAERCDTPSWWTELSTVPGEDDTRKLARQVRVSFGLPWQLEVLDAEGGTLQAPPAPSCLHRQRFMQQADSIFASQDIREVPREKVVVYARALQYWAEQNDLPTGGKPHSLAESVLELRKEVRWYLTFTDEEVFWGVAIPKAENIPESPLWLKLEPKERTPKVVGWDKVLHPPQPMVAAGEIPKLTQISRPRGKILSAFMNDTWEVSSLLTKSIFSA